MAAIDEGAYEQLEGAWLLRQHVLPALLPSALGDAARLLLALPVPLSLRPRSRRHRAALACALCDAAVHASASCVPATLAKLSCWRSALALLSPSASQSSHSAPSADPATRDALGALGWTCWGLSSARGGPADACLGPLARLCGREWPREFPRWRSYSAHAEAVRAAAALGLPRMLRALCSRETFGRAAARQQSPAELLRLAAASGSPGAADVVRALCGPPFNARHRNVTGPAHRRLDALRGACRRGDAELLRVLLSAPLRVPRRELVEPPDDEWECHLAAAAARGRVDVLRVAAELGRVGRDGVLRALVGACNRDCCEAVRALGSLEGFRGVWEHVSGKKLCGFLEINCKLPMQPRVVALLQGPPFGLTAEHVRGLTRAPLKRITYRITTHNVQTAPLRVPRRELVEPPDDEWECHLAAAAARGRVDVLRVAAELGRVGRDGVLRALVGACNRDCCEAVRALGSLEGFRGVWEHVSGKKLCGFLEINCKLPMQPRVVALLQGPPFGLTAEHVRGLTRAPLKRITYRITTHNVQT
eukprot:m51a1_g3693 hypothetical protein (535) ;mRNA; f:356488-358220